MITMMTMMMMTMMMMSTTMMITMGYEIKRKEDCVHEMYTELSNHTIVSMTKAC